MKLYDITRTAQEAPIYPGSAPVEIDKLSDMAAGAEYNECLITAGSHMGTHADAFSHFLEGGATIDKMDLERYCGKCRVVTVTSGELITMDDIRGRIAGTQRLLLRTGGACLCEEAAEYIVSCGVKTLVTDALSVGPADNEAGIHRILFAGDVAVVENAVLDGVDDGEYLLFAFPVKYGGCDGAPVRAVLIAED